MNRLVLCLMGAGWFFGLTAALGAETLTLDQALKIALDQNRDIKTAEEYRQYVQGRYIEERAAAFPNVHLDVSRLKSSDETQEVYMQMGGGESGGAMFPFPTEQTIKSADVTLSQPLFTWGKVGAAIRAARSGIASADEQLRAYQQAVQRDVTAAFQNVLLARELTAIARENLDLKKRHYEEAERKFTAGTATDYDVLAARVAVENAQPELIRAENLVRTTRDQLGFLLALENRDVDVVGNLEVHPESVPTFESALATALAHRPDLAQQAHTVDVYKELVKISKAGDKPRLDLKATYGVRNYDIGMTDMTGNTWSVGLFLGVPVFDGLRTRGLTKQALSNFRTQELATFKLRDSISLEVRNALHSLEESAEILKALAGTVEQAQKLLTMAEKGYELGVKTQLDVQDAQVNLKDARGNLARAQRDYLVAQVNLRYVTGTLIFSRSN